MSETQILLSEIDDFLRRTGMAATTFGQKSVRNWKIVDHLRSGGDTGLKTAARIRAFMAEYPKDKSKAA